MYIKEAHTHVDGKRCLAVKRMRASGHGLVTFTKICRHPHSNDHVIGWFGYSGSWIVYDVTTGKEIARMDREYFDRFIRPFVVVEDLIPDPDCVV